LLVSRSRGHRWPPAQSVPVSPLPDRGPARTALRLPLSPSPAVMLGAQRLRIFAATLQFLESLRDRSRGPSSICDTFVTRSMRILRSITRVLRNSLLLIAPCPPRNKGAWRDAWPRTPDRLRGQEPLATAHPAAPRLTHRLHRADTDILANTLGRNRHDPYPCANSSERQLANERPAAGRSARAG